MFDNSTKKLVNELAQQLGVEPAVLFAVIEVESAGTIMWNVNGKQRPAIRFEGHYFHKRLKGAQLQAAVAAGLANPKAGAVANPRSYSARYALLERAKDINEAVALESTSWGLGQVMGANWKRLGYGSVNQLVKEAESGAEGQIKLMVEYIEDFGLVPSLKSKDWESFAHGYNGPAHAKGNYAGKMATAYARYSSGKSAEGIDREKTKAWQKDLKTLGFYKGEIDGLIGPKTKAAIRSFQRTHGLVDDGIVGPMVLATIAEEIKALKIKKAETLETTGKVVVGTDGVGQVVLEGAKELQPIAETSQTLQYILFAVLFLGVALVAWAMYSKRKAAKE
jgi:hypothetical protein